MLHECVLNCKHSHLSSEDKGLVLQSVYALLVTCLPSLPVERVHKGLLHHAIPAVQVLFKEVLLSFEAMTNNLYFTKFILNDPICLISPWKVLNYGYMTSLLWTFKILSKHCQVYFRQVTSQSILAIPVSLTTKINFNFFLKVCNELLKCMESVLEYIVLKGRISISCVPTVPKTVASLMLQTFKHCRER